MSNRTTKGTVTSTARDKYGDDEGKFPIFDQKSALSAIKLRHNGKGVSPESVLSRAAAWARAHNNKTVLAVIDAARETDKKQRS